MLRIALMAGVFAALAVIQTRTMETPVEGYGNSPGWTDLNGRFCEECPTNMTLTRIDVSLRITRINVINIRL